MVHHRKVSSGRGPDRRSASIPVQPSNRQAPKWQSEEPADHRSNRGPEPPSSIPPSSMAVRKQLNAVVSRRQDAHFQQLLHAFEATLQRRRVLHVGASVSDLSEHRRQRRSPEPVAPRAQVHEEQLALARVLDVWSDGLGDVGARCRRTMSHQQTLEQLSAGKRGVLWTARQSRQRV